MEVNKPMFDLMRIDPACSVVLSFDTYVSQSGDQVDAKTISMKLRLGDTIYIYLENTDIDMYTFGYHEQRNLIQQWWMPIYYLNRERGIGIVDIYKQHYKFYRFLDSQEFYDMIRDRKVVCLSPDIEPIELPEIRKAVATSSVFLTDTVTCGDGFRQWKIGRTYDKSQNNEIRQQAGAMHLAIDKLIKKYGKEVFQHVAFVDVVERIAALKRGDA